MALEVKRRPSRKRERGAAMLVTLVVISAVMAGGAALFSITMASTRSAQLTKTTTQALYCAEAGLTIARSAVAANYRHWNAAFAAGTVPAWLQAVSHDIDGDGVDDVALSVVDNEDEGAAANDATRDNDRSARLVSRCIAYPETPREVTEIVQYNGGGQCYESQQGGCGENNNANR